jgi:hypothetical protein
MIKNLFKKAVTAGASWIGGKIGGPTGSTIASKITSSLFSRPGKGGGGDFQLQDTSVAQPNYGGKVGFERSDDASVVRKQLKTANAEELNNEWDYRLTKWFRNKDQMFT